MTTEQEPQAQAGEPRVFAIVTVDASGNGRIQWLGMGSELLPAGEHKLITLQSHREAMARAEEKYQTLFAHLMDVYAEFGAKWGDNIFLSITQHSAKKDAALDACVEALEASNDLIGSGLYKEAVPRAAAVMKSTAAITQAKEARK